MRSSRRKYFPKNQAGFALVITVVLLVLLTVIAVGLLQLSAVSLRVASQGQAAAEARANARLALMMAIGQLQAELGPDQRVNAPADFAGSGLTGGRQKWVGTWESWPANARSRPAPQFRRWLVSGTPDSVASASFPTQASGLVSLMRGTGADLMSAPKVVMENGGLAYAVADENSKARLGPASGAANRETMADHLIGYQSPSTGHNLLPGLQDVARNEPLMAQLVSTKSIDLLPGSQTRQAEDATSFSAWSEGLLTDVRNGGFRKDLSLHFTRPESGNVANALYTHNGRRGINFRELRNFHEVSSRLTYNSGSFSHPDGGRLNAQVPAMVGLPAQAGAATDPFFAYQRPVMIRSSWHISAYSRVQGTATNPSYRIFIVLEPLIWLWNPFDVNLVMRPGGHLTVRCWGLPYDVIIRAGSTNRRVHFNRIRQNQGDNIAMEIGQNTPVVLRPGEVQIFSRGRRASTPTDQFARFEGLPGWSTTGGFSLDTGITVNAATPVGVALTPSTTRGATSWGLIEFLSYVGTDSSNLYWNGGTMIDRSGFGSALTAMDFPKEMFAEVPERVFSSAANLSEPQPVALFSYLARTEREGVTKSRYLSRLNPGAMGFDHQAIDPNSLQSLPYEPLMQPLSGGLDRGFDFNEGKGFFGASYKADVGQSYLVTHSIPRERPISLGSFQHAIANGVESWTFTGPNAGDFHNRILQPSINHPIGNSFAPPSISPGQTSGNFNGMAAVDHSWLANEALWDQWFVSSLATRNAPHHSDGQAGTARSLFDQFSGRNGDPVPLPNRHYVYAGTQPERDATDLFSSATPKVDAHLRVAALMRVHGAFNINSTDPAAWLAMFRSTSGLRVPVEDSDGSTVRWEGANNPVAGLLVPKGPAVMANDLGDPSAQGQWTGYRDLTDDELRELANAMVEEVKKRGPFLSLADFVNRRLSSDKELASRGALQAALDLSINKRLESGGRGNGGGARGVAFPEADAGAQMTHVPGHVKQGDILTTLGTRFTARSDTFTIRAYGESRSSSGVLLATARCEAVIQRGADFLDAADEPHIPIANLTREVNKRFGRKMNIVAFRWLSPNEP